MTRVRIFFHRLLGLFLRRKLERDLQEEIRSHLEMQVEDELRQWESLEDARRAARLRFGGVEQVKEAYRERSVTSGMTPKIFTSIERAIEEN